MVNITPPDFGVGRAYCVSIPINYDFQIDLLNDNGCQFISYICDNYVSIFCIMRKLLSIIVTTLLVSSLSAQESLDFFDVAEDVFSKEFSVQNFAERYDANILENDNYSTFEVKGVQLVGYECKTILYLDGLEQSDVDLRALCAMPEINLFSKTDQYLFAMKWHSFMLDRFGTPDRTEVVQAQDEAILEETKYIWIKDEIEITGTYSKTKSFPFYRIALTNSPSLPRATSTPVQRTFFKKLELGKVIDKARVVSALGCSTYDIQAVKTSHGTEYQYSTPLYFGGFEWTNCKFGTVGDTLYEVCLEHRSKRSNKELFEGLSDALTEKYGVSQTEGDVKYWLDAQTGIVLTYKYAMSRGGEMMHYVELMYADLELNGRRQEIINSEL